MCWICVYYLVFIVYNTYCKFEIWLLLFILLLFYYLFYFIIYYYLVFIVYNTYCIFEIWFKGCRETCELGRLVLSPSFPFGLSWFDQLDPRHEGDHFGRWTGKGCCWSWIIVGKTPGAQGEDALISLITVAFFLQRREHWPQWPFIFHTSSYILQYLLTF